jgi:hypothetical protein
MTDAAAPEYTTDGMMTVAASRELKDGAVCFVGIGLPSEATNLARATRSQLRPDLRVGDRRSQARCPPALHRGRGAGRVRRLGRVGA